MFTFLLVSLVPESGSAQGLDLGSPGGPPVARHIKRGSGVKLLRTQPAFMGLDRFAKGTQDVAAVEFTGPLSRLPRGAGTFDYRPNCEKPDVRQEKVLYDTKELSFFDIVLYNYRDPEQVRQADAWERPAAPFLEGDKYNPRRDTANLQQEVGRFLGVRCLPTRIHYVYIDGVRYEEHREGARAWDRDN